jgi:hypothetical protein
MSRQRTTGAVLIIGVCALAACSGSTTKASTPPAATTTIAAEEAAVPVGNLEKEFRAYEAQRGIDPSTFEAEAALLTIEDFWRAVPVQGVAQGAPSDMLEYRWGTKPWGEGRSFQLEFTRRVVAPDGKVWPMNVTLHYQPSAVTTTFGSGERTLSSQQELAKFGVAVSSTDAYRYGHQHQPESVEIRYQPA